MVQEAPNRLQTTSKKCFVLLWNGSKWFDTLLWAHFQPATFFRWKMMKIHLSCTRAASCRSSAGPSGETLKNVEFQRISLKSIGSGLAGRLKISPDLENLRKMGKFKEILRIAFKNKRKSSGNLWDSSENLQNFPSEAARELGRPWAPKASKTMKIHLKLVLNGTRSTEPTSNHLKKLFCNTLEWFQVVWHTLVTPFWTRHNFSMKNGGNPPVLHSAGLLSILGWA